MADGNLNQDMTVESPNPPLHYACTPWRCSSQRVADLYHSGTKLWSKADLKDIESQLEQSFHIEKFTLRDLNGRQIQVKNPDFKVQRPIWKPYVKYRDYWSLVLVQPEGPSELYYCSYIIDWKNTLGHDFVGNIEGWKELFETRRQLWNASITYKLFTKQLRKLLFEGNFFVAEHRPGLEVGLASEYSNTMIQHAMAMTIAEEASKYSQNVSLIAQDPGYKDCSVRFLHEKGFEVKGQFGAGALAEVDDESLVIFAYASAPIRQIIADIAKPAMFITDLKDCNIVASQTGKPSIDAESPRTMQMWESYERYEFPTSSVERGMMEGVRRLSIFARK